MRKILGTAVGTALILSLAACGGSADAPTTVAKGDLEKPVLKLGFIKLTDMAPLAIAKEKGFFAEEGLTVQLEPHARHLYGPQRRAGHLRQSATRGLARFDPGDGCRECQPAQ